MQNTIKIPRYFQTDEIHLRDPFVFVDTENKEYLLFGTTFADGIGTIEPHFSFYRSNNLVEWEGPFMAFNPQKGFWGVRHFWAPEVHQINGMYYMFFSAKGGIGEKRGTGILVAEKPEGPYRDHSGGPVTPRDWESLDGTFYQDKQGQNWLIFCREWTENSEGTIHAIRLRPDLKDSIGEPIELLKASAKDWVRPFHDIRSGQTGYLTDAPYLYETADGGLILLWSSYSDKSAYSGGYTVACKYSKSGNITGPWEDQGLLLDVNAGHPSIFTDLKQNTYLCVHSPDTPHGTERPVFIPLKEEHNRLWIDEI